MGVLQNLAPKSTTEGAQRVGAGALTSGLSEVDRATGGNVAKGLSGAGEWLGANSPFKNLTPPKYEPNAVADVTVPTLDPSVQAAQINTNGLTGAKIGAIADPRMAVINQAPQNQFRDQQLAVAQNLAAQANGTGPSVAVNTLRKGQEANLAGTMAVLNSQRGAANPALARQAMQTNAQTQGNMAMDASTARLQEQMAAAGMLNNVAGTARGQDVSLATSQGQLDSAANLAKYQGSLQTALEQGRIDQNTFNEQMQNARANAQLTSQFQTLQAQYASMGLNAAEANQMAALKVEQMKSDAQNANNSLQAADSARRQGLIGSLVNGAASIAGGMVGGAPAGLAGSSAATNPLAQPGGSAAAQPQQQDFTPSYMQPMTYGSGGY